MHTFLSFINVGASWNSNTESGELRKGLQLRFLARENDENGRYLYDFLLKEDRTCDPTTLHLLVGAAAWAAFTDFPGLFEFLRDNSTMTFSEVLASVADVYWDATQYEYPYAS